MSVTSSQIHQLVQILSKEFDVGNKFIVSCIKKSIQSMKNEKKSTPANNPDDNTKLCSYIYQRGNKKNVKCTLACKQDSNCCSRHCKKTDDKKKDKIINKKVETIKIINKLMKLKPTLEINRNKYGNFETSNNLVYDINTKEIVGFQNNGSVRDLTKVEIEWCKENNLKFKFPFNLNLEEKNKSSLLLEEQASLEDELNEDYEEVEEDEYDDVED